MEEKASLFREGFVQSLNETSPHYFASFDNDVLYLEEITVIPTPEKLTCTHPLLMLFNEVQIRGQKSHKWERCVPTSPWDDNVKKFLIPFENDWTKTGDKPTPVE
jgi:hypothetical protein